MVKMSPGALGAETMGLLLALTLLPTGAMAEDPKGEMKTVRKNSHNPALHGPTTTVVVRRLSLSLSLSYVYIFKFSCRLFFPRCLAWMESIVVFLASCRRAEQA